MGQNKSKNGDKTTSENEDDNLQEGNGINFEFNKPIIKKRIIFEYSNLTNSILINDKNENLISDFTDIEKSKIIYSSEAYGLFYITMDNKCYYHNDVKGIILKDLNEMKKSLIYFVKSLKESLNECGIYCDVQFLINFK